MLVDKLEKVPLEALAADMEALDLSQQTVQQLLACLQVRRD